MMFTLFQVIGTVAPPTAISAYGATGGLIKFLSSVMTVMIAVGGLWALINIMMAGIQYISAKGDPKQMGNVIQTLSGSLIGIALMILAPVIMAIIGFVFFRDATFFLSPKIISPTG